MPFMTLWTLGRKQCVVFIDPPEHHFDLRIIEEDAVILEQLNVSFDDVIPTAQRWECQYSDGPATSSVRSSSR